MPRFVSIACLAISMTLLPACSTDEGDPSTAIAATKVTAISAIKAARDAVKGSWPLEFEMDIEDSKAVFSVDLWVDGGIETVVIDGLTGSLIRQETSTLSDKEQHALSVLDTLPNAKRMKLVKAIKLANAKFKDARPVEADFKLRDEVPIFVIQLLVGEAKETIEIPVTLEDSDPDSGDDSTDDEG